LKLNRNLCSHSASFLQTSALHSVLFLALQTMAAPVDGSLLAAVEELFAASESSVVTAVRLSKSQPASAWNLSVRRNRVTSKPRILAVTGQDCTWKQCLCNFLPIYVEGYEDPFGWCDRLTSGVVFLEVNPNALVIGMLLTPCVLVTYWKVHMMRLCSEQHSLSLSKFVVVQRSGPLRRSASRSTFM
jgi:hypothetical protein